MRRDAGALDPLSPRSFALWFGVVGPPLAWGAHLVLGDLIFELGCSPGVRGHALFGVGLETWALVTTTVLAAVTAAAGLFAYRAWQVVVSLSNGTSWGRAHAMSLAGMASAAIYLALLAFGFVAPFFLHSCGTSL